MKGPARPGSAAGVAVADGVAVALPDGDVDGLAVGLADALGFTAALEEHAASTSGAASATNASVPGRRGDRAGVTGAGRPPATNMKRGRRSRHARPALPACEAGAPGMRDRRDGSPSASICLQQMSYADSEDAAAVRAALGALIRRRRVEAERSLTAVAEAAGISTAFLSELERGLKDVSTEKVVAIARALELSPAQLYADLARELGVRAAVPQRSWPDDPKMQVRLATAKLRPQALRAVADFSLYLAATQATPPRRRIGFTIDR